MTEYGLFYTGLKDENYYYEVTYVNFKKLIFISLSSILSTTTSFTKVNFRLTDFCVLGFDWYWLSILGATNISYYIPILRPTYEFY